MEIDPEELKQGYRDLSDEGLLALNREDLTEFARRYYDEEIAARGLQSESAEPASNPTNEPDEELVRVATYISLDDADLGRALLSSAEIPAFLESEISSSWAGSGALRLMVPASLAKQAEEILEAQISDEDLLAQAEAAQPRDTDENDTDENDNEKDSA